MQWFGAAVLGLVGVAAFGLAPDTTLPVAPVETIVRELPLPVQAEDDAPAVTYWREERVQRGDTIGSLLARAGVDDPEAQAFVRTDRDARALYQLRPGRPVRFATDDEGRLVELRFLTPRGTQLLVARTADRFESRLAVPVENVRTSLATGEIRSSLFGAADAVGLPDAVTLALADVFAGDIDFYHDLRRGDRFTVLYETRFVDGEPVGTGRVLAAEFVNRGTTLRAFFWRAPDGTEGWYAEGGKNTRKAFLRTPMAFSRITSGFSGARFHPILRTWRAHRGIDYAAPTGTPVLATADGIVTFAGHQGGYGNAVVLRHGGSYSTLYGHLSRFAVRIGARVRQGDTLGYVGQTGWATGPHLHYEFRVADAPRDPLKIALPSAQPIAHEELDAFAAQARPLAAQLDLARELPGGLVAATE